MVAWARWLLSSFGEQPCVPGRMASGGLRGGAACRSRDMSVHVLRASISDLKAAAAGLTELYGVESVAPRLGPAAGSRRQHRRAVRARLSEAISARRPDRLAYFAFDLLYLDGHDLRRCSIEDQKASLSERHGQATKGCRSALALMAQAHRLRQLAKLHSQAGLE